MTTKRKAMMRVGGKKSRDRTVAARKKKPLVLSRWRGFEDDGSSGCYHYNFKKK